MNNNELKKKHFLDKPILRDLFWFIVLPYNLEQQLEEAQKQNNASEAVKNMIQFLNDYRFLRLF